MAKKIAFLLAMMFVLILASVTAFAAGTDSTTPEAGFTEDKTDSARILEELESKYEDVFFDPESKSDKNIIDLKYERMISVKHPLRYIFVGTAIDSTTGSAIVDNPVVMLMYIKKDGEYVPLCDVDTETHIIEKPNVVDATVDLLYLGSNKVNEVRIIAFRKKDLDSLALNENLQIIDLQISVNKWNIIEKVKIIFEELTTP